MKIKYCIIITSVAAGSCFLFLFLGFFFSSFKLLSVQHNIILILNNFSLLIITFVRN